MVPKYNLPGAISMRKTIQKERRLQYVKPFMSGDDIAFLQYTGGTTGVAKGAILTHSNMIANVMQAKAMYGPVLISRESIVTRRSAISCFCPNSKLLIFSLN